MKTDRSNSPRPAARDSNIELLRIITMLGVIILHYNNRSMGGGLRIVSNNSINFHFLNVLESVFICAVNLFILITGYFMINSQKRSILKPLRLVIQVSVFKTGLYFVSVFLGKEAFTGKNLWSSVLPNNYFVILYAALYFISPYINLVMKSLSKKQLKRLVVTLMLLFSVYAVTADVLGDLNGGTITGLSPVGMYGSQSGYTVVNFTLMYIIGAYIRLCEDDIMKIGKGRLAAAFAILVLLDTVWSLVCLHFGKTDSTPRSYLNPIVILLAAVAFVLFKHIKLGQKKLINTLAKGSFTVFLMHTYFLSYLKIDRFVNRSLPILAAHILISVTALYLIGWVAYFIYESITSPIFKALEKKFPKMAYTVENNLDQSR